MTTYFMMALGVLVIILILVANDFLVVAVVYCAVSDRLNSRRNKKMMAGRIIDCSAQPYIPDGWEIRPEDQIASRTKNRLVFGRGEIVLHLEEEQKTGTIVGTDLYAALEGKQVLPASVLDWLLENKRIPDSWKKNEQGWTRYIFFWGTIYRGSGGDRYVRCLYWNGERWEWFYRQLANDWTAQYSAAILAS